MAKMCRGSSWTSVASRARETSQAELGVPSVVFYELEYGTLKASGPGRRGIRVELEYHGYAIGPVDLMIAGTAISRGALPATGNTKEFSRVKGLRLEDWTR